MRSLVIAMVLAAGFGLAGSSSAISAPISSKAVGDIAKSQSVTQDVRYCRRHCRHGRYSHRRCWRSCY
jgi:hypothetical protein